MGVPVEPLGNWHKLFGEFATSPTNFYEAVESAISRRKIPDVQTERILWRESGFTSAKREYLRITRGQHVFDICAAKFGAGFFFSWWFAQVRHGAAKPTLAILLLSALVLWLPQYLITKEAILWIVVNTNYVWLFGMPFLPGLIISLFILLVLFWAAGAYMAQGESELASSLLAVPVLGRMWAAMFLPVTYYRIDTQTMFRSAVQAAVLEAIDGLTEAKGLKALTEEERKPIMKEFFRK